MKGKKMGKVQDVTVYGTGCRKCEKLHANAVEAVKRNGADIKVNYVTDVVAISAAGIMSTPALAIDGQVVSVGKIVSVEDLVTWLGGEEPQAAGAGNACGCGGNC